MARPGPEDIADALAEALVAAEDAARRLLHDPELRRCVEALPFAAGDRVVAAGDSITEDPASWAEILRHALRMQRPDDRIEVVNEGVSGDTSVGLLERFGPILERDPDWLLVMIGTNDACRYGPGATEPTVSDDESRGAIAALGERVRAGSRAELVWITPPPVHEERIAIAVELGKDEGGETAWLDVDVSEKARIVRAQRGRLVDLAPAFPAARLERLLQVDGLHPSLEGQLAIAGAVVRTLGS
jgi:acyl-CoA thioesterase-1